MRSILLLAFLAFCSVLAGCGSVPLSYQPTLQNLEVLRVPDMGAANVGKFALAPGKSSSMDRSVAARATAVVSPHDNSFAMYLKEALKQELIAAGKYDTNATVVINGLLTENSLDASMGTGKGVLGARFSVAREGNLVYQKDLVEKAEWPSAFVGADAIPTAISEYASLYKKLLNRLFRDQDFKKATQAK